MAPTTALLPFLLLLLSASTHATTDIPISHTHSSPDSLLTTAATFDSPRLLHLASLAKPRRQPPTTSVPIASGQQLASTNNYLLRVKLGTPPQTMLVVLDTSSDTSFVPCSGCTGCPASTLFSPSGSTTYSTVNCSSPQCSQLVRGGGPQCSPSAAGPGRSPCNFAQSYGGDSTFLATLSRDSLGLGSDVVPGFAFGCVNTVNGGSSMPKQGLMGLGRGPMSLVSQTGLQYKGVFSYCLPSFKSVNFTGSLRLGPAGQPKSVKTTPLLRNNRRQSLYYVNLTGISVGKTLLAVAPESLAFDPATGAGTVVDTETMISRFVQPLYAALRDEFRRQVGAAEYTTLGGFDTCFGTAAGGGPAAPNVTLHFAGADLPLPAENVLIHSSSTPLACLAMAAAPDNVNSVVNVIASLQQQNHRVVFDVANSRVGFVREACN